MLDEQSDDLTRRVVAERLRSAAAHPGSVVAIERLAEERHDEIRAAEESHALDEAPAQLTRAGALRFGLEPSESLFLGNVFEPVERLLREVGGQVEALDPDPIRPAARHADQQRRGA